MRLWSKWWKGGSLRANILQRQGIDPKAAAARERFKQILDKAETTANERLKCEEQASTSLSRDERNVRWEALFFDAIRNLAKACAAETRRG
ncbi:MAG: hypothetical protein ACQETK_12310 [Pseudomonadota bacterium]